MARQGLLCSGLHLLEDAFRYFVPGIGHGSARLGKAWYGMGCKAYSRLEAVGCAVGSHQEAWCGGARRGAARRGKARTVIRSVVTGA